MQQNKKVNCTTTFYCSCQLQSDQFQTPFITQNTTQHHKETQLYNLISDAILRHNTQYLGSLSLGSLGADSYTD